MAILIIFAAICGLSALWTEFSRTLMMLQQNSYRIDRYNRYLNNSGEMTSVGKLLGAALLLFCLIGWVPMWMAAALQIIFFVIYKVKALRKKYKKPLVVTPRVNRLYGAMYCIFVLLCVWFSLGQSLEGVFMAIATVALGCWFASPWIAMAAVWLLKPVEKRINQKYVDDAARIIASMPDLKVIGITGSYGKTSTKHYLQRILSEKFSVCMTPGSFNTTMGVVRTIREYLKPYDQVFICEMGAKQPGDIKEICDLVHPVCGIVTAVGPQHLESFKTIENVQRTKFELIDSLPADGLAIINDDFPFVANRPVSNVEAIRYGVKGRPEIQYWVDDINYSASGTDFTIWSHDAEPLRLHTQLVGECNVSNLVAAVIVGLRLGVSREQIAYAVEKIEQVEHRLSIKRLPGNVTIIDDAFNSNPTGSAMALDVLAAMPGTRVIITPGMIELGSEQFELNRKFGEKIACSCDVAIIVGHYNREAILAGLEGTKGVNVLPVDSFTEALTLLPKSDYTVLYENDLPDTFK